MPIAYYMSLPTVMHFALYFKLSLSLERSDFGYRAQVILQDGNPKGKDDS